MPIWTKSINFELPASLVGRKAAALGRLITAGFPVPASLCIITEAYYAALSASPDLSRLPDGLLEELTAALPMDAALAVRSSAVLEDLPETSHAGRYNTHLNVTGQAALELAILDCWRSNSRSPSGDGGGGMAVLIQPLVEAECAGVCFSVDPVRLRPDLLLVVSAWGLGAGVVAGSVPTDTARLRRVDLGVEDFTTADKYSGVYAAPVGGGVRAVSIPEDLRAIPCLPKSWLERVAQIGLAVEQVFGKPQDVEWAIARGQLWVLQSRPITALPVECRAAVQFPIAWENADEARQFWWLWVAHDSIGTPLLPAEHDFNRINRQGSLEAVYYSGSAHTRLLKTVNGRIYMAAADSPHPAGHVRVYGAAMRELYERLAQKDITVWEHWGPEIVRATERLAAFDPRGADGTALAEHLEDAIAAVSRPWMIHTLSPRMIHSPALLDVYVRMTHLSPEDAKAEIPFLVAGAETIQTRLIKTLYDLARMAFPAPEDARAIALAYKAFDTPDGADLNSLTPELEPFARTFSHLMAEYGGRMCSRAVPGFPFELWLPWREAPEHVWEIIVEYLPLARQDGPGPRETRATALRAGDERVVVLCAATSDAALVAEFQRALAFARRNAAGLDEHNHYIDQLSQGQTIQALLYAGRWLAGRGCLPNPYEVFWLTSDEVLAALRDPEAALEAVIALRRNQFEEQRAQIAPACLGLPDFKLPKRPSQLAHVNPAVHPEDQVANQLSGEPASRGHAAGRARLIITEALPAEFLPGDVLVARSAGWSLIPLLPAAAALVLDTGGPGDHFAITAREFGLPCVCATGFATLRIPEGAWVTVDADNGLVIWR